MFSDRSFGLLCADDTPMVRRAAATHLGVSSSLVSLSTKEPLDVNRAIGKHES